MKKTVIFDLDGTLANIDVRRDKALKPDGKLDWEIFAAPQSILDLDEPNLPVIKMAQYENVRIVVERNKNVYVCEHTVSVHQTT